MPGLIFKNALLAFKPNVQAGLQAKHCGLGGLALKARGITMNQGVQCDIGWFSFKGIAMLQTRYILKVDWEKDEERWV